MVFCFFLRPEGLYTKSYLGSSAPLGSLDPVTRICQWLPTSKRFGVRKEETAMPRSLFQRDSGDRKGMAKDCEKERNEIVRKEDKVAKRDQISTLSSAFLLNFISFSFSYTVLWRGWKDR